jgi:RND family efflux transporter MFP subunit
MKASQIHTIAVLLITGGVLAGCNRKTPEIAAPSVVTGLTVTQAVEQQIANSVEVVGTVHAKESAIISAQVMGRVTSVKVREGDSVRAGQLLIALDDEQARSRVEGSRAGVAASERQVEAAQAEASLASSTLARYQLLRERKSVSAQEFDEVERRSQAADARLEAARAEAVQAKAADSGAGTAAGYARISAPFAGVVIARHVDPGAIAMPGTPLIEVEKAGVLELDATVDESLVQVLKSEMAVPVTIAAVSSQALVGHVREINPAGDPGSHSFLVKIELPPAVGLRSGMFGTAEFGNGRRSALLVPQAAVITHGSLNGVWALDGNRLASLRYITLGAKREGSVEVLSGLSAGETVVLAAGDRELGGSRIEVR